ncbi:MAG TPA: Fur family transcriptional regulator [Thermoanaerobaculia bacterium]|nr:Fur family transcriptional regulator [Thermoanaerobaculia bacterium]
MQRSDAQVELKVSAMIEKCREAGMNITPQRVAIYRALVRSEEHPTPEMLYQTVAREMPSLSLATIYKTLDSLAEIGLVRSVPVVSDKKRFDANDDPHHHLVCTRCGMIRDYHTHQFDDLIPRRQVQGFTAQSVSVNISGICAECRRKGKEEQA